MKGRFLLFIGFLLFSAVVNGQSKKGWSVTTEKKIVYFSPRMLMAGNDSILLVGDTASLFFAINDVEKITYHRDGRSGWPGTFLGTIAGALVGVFIFNNNDDHRDLENSEKVVGGTFTGLAGAIVGGVAGGFLYKQRTIEDTVVLSDLFYPQKQLKVQEIYMKHSK